MGEIQNMAFTPHSHVCYIGVTDFKKGGGGESVRRIFFKMLHTQIAGTRAEPQQIVAQRLLSCLQYPVPYLSRLQRI